MGAGGDAAQLRSRGGSVVVHAHDYGNFEKVADLGSGDVDITYTLAN